MTERDFVLRFICAHEAGPAILPRSSLVDGGREIYKTVCELIPAAKVEPEAPITATAIRIISDHQELYSAIERLQNAVDFDRLENDAASEVHEIYCTLRDKHRKFEKPSND